MRVLHVTPYFAPAFRYGGPPRSVLGLCRALLRAGVVHSLRKLTEMDPIARPAIIRPS